MARIRSDKPESYQSETLAEVSLAAERTFRGMATIADDRGRLADKPAQINGDLWAMRSEREPHTSADLEAELQEMVKADLICRYVGCDGKRYLHPVKWDAHQKIDRPSRSRLPRCPVHQGEPDYCGLHMGACVHVEPSPDPPDPSRDTRESSRDLQSPQTGHRETGAHAEHSDQGEPIAVGTPGPRADGRTSSEQAQQQSSRDSREPSMLDLGSRTVDRGSINQPPRAGARGTPLANQLLDEHVAACNPTPSRGVRTQVGEAIDALLDEPEIQPDEIRAGLALLRSKPNLGPGALKNLVDEIRRVRANPSLARASPPPRGNSRRRGGAADDLSHEVYGQGRTRI